MNKHFWIAVDPDSSDQIIAAIEAGATGLLVPAAQAETIQRQARTTLIAEQDAPGVDLVLGRDVDRCRIDSEDDEDRVDTDRLTIVDPAAWTIIPLENLLSRGAKVIQTVRTPEETQIALTTMEHGAAGILLVEADSTTIRAVGQTVATLTTPPIPLESARILSITPAGLGDRGCIDTIGLFAPGEGLLVGDYAHAQFLVHSENITTEHCAPRPFRVNAGAVHGYVRQPDDRTRYLGELRSGDPVLVVAPSGATRRVGVGRNKIERRPMLHVLAETATGTRISAMLQNAETIALIDDQGRPQSVTRLMPGQTVIVALSPVVGRHFGRPIEETIREQ